MSETPETPPETCRAVGQLVDAAGKRRAWLRCDLPAGHDATRECDGSPVGPWLAHSPHTIQGTPHRALFEWADDEVQRDDWPEAYDPDEPVDVDVPELDDEALAEIAESRRIDAEVDAQREAAAWPDE